MIKRTASDRCAREVLPGSFCVMERAHQGNCRMGGGYDHQGAADLRAMMAAEAIELGYTEAIERKG